MRKYILLAAILIAGSGNAMATDWDTIEELTRNSFSCLEELQDNIHVSNNCKAINTTKYVIKYAEPRVKDYNGFPSFILRNKFISFDNDHYIPINDLIVPVSKGKKGNYVAISIVGRFVRLDDDDPLKTIGKGKLSNIIFIVEAVKGRPPTFVEKMVGEVIINKEYADASVQYKEAKALRLKKTLKEEAKVKIFGLPLYGANRDSLLIAMKKNSIERIGAINGYYSDVFDTSKVVKGTVDLDVFYDKKGRIGRLTYHFGNSSLDSVLERFSRVYGTSNSDGSLGDTWILGRITISLNSQKTKNSEHVSVNYSIEPFAIESLEGNFERDHMVDSNAF